MFSGSCLLITGGTGSFGHAVLRRFLDTPVREIRVFSRDEKKQDDLRRQFKSDKLKFYLGDVRDPATVLNAMRGVDHVFHAAALKQVPSCEFHPLEAVKTNVLGTENVLEAALASGVQRVVCLSTDKAVYPINAMGLSKALMEKVMVAKSRNLDDARITICATRYGNVLATRGSVVPLFVDQIRGGRPLTVTDPAMTRFMMTLDEAVELVLQAFERGRNGDVFVQKSPAATLGAIADAVRTAFGAPDHPVTVIGTRHGEKLYETLLSREEMAKAQDLGRYFLVPADRRNLSYENYIDRGEETLSVAEDYNSHNTTRLDVPALVAMLDALDYVKAAKAGRTIEIDA